MVSFGPSKRRLSQGSASTTREFSAPRRRGKTAVAAWLIAKRKVNTLILVHRQQLLDQWQERLAMFLNMPQSRSGISAAEKIHRKAIRCRGHSEPLSEKEAVKDFVAEYGQVIVDDATTYLRLRLSR